MTSPDVIRLSRRLGVIPREQVDPSGVDSRSPTVVLENGVTNDWYALQNRLSGLTRVCSYDPARWPVRSAAAPILPRARCERA